MLAPPRVVNRELTMVKRALTTQETATKRAELALQAEQNNTAKLSTSARARPIRPMQGASLIELHFGRHFGVPLDPEKDLTAEREMRAAADLMHKKSTQAYEAAAKRESEERYARSGSFTRIRLPPSSADASRARGVVEHAHDTGRSWRPTCRP